MFCGGFLSSLDHGQRSVPDVSLDIAVVADANANAAAAAAAAAGDTDTAVDADADADADANLDDDDEFFSKVKEACLCNKARLSAGRKTTQYMPAIRLCHKAVAVQGQLKGSAQIQQHTSDVSREAMFLVDQHQLYQRKTSVVKVSGQVLPKHPQHIGAAGQKTEFTDNLGPGMYVLTTMSILSHICLFLSVCLSSLLPEMTHGLPLQAHNVA